MKPTAHATLTAVALMLVAFAAPRAHAAVAYLDFTLTGSGATTPGNWNNFAQPGTYRFQNVAQPVTVSSDLIDKNGLPTGVAVTVTNTGSSGPAGEAFAGSIAGYPTTATQDAFFASGTTSITFSNLTAGAEYNLSLVSAITNSIPSTTNFKINGYTQSIDPETDPGVVDFAGITADGSGQILLEWSGAGGAGFLNAFKLNTAPQQQTVLVDFRGDNSGGTDAAGFINIFDPSSSTRFQNLAKPFTIFSDMIDDNGDGTGYGLVLATAAGNSGPAGEILTDAVAGFPTGASRDTLFLTNAGSATGLNFDITNLKAGHFYDLDFVIGVDPTKTGVTEITINGVTQAIDHDAANSHLLSFTDIAPDANGVIRFNWASQNDGELAFLNALSITTSVIPAPAALPAGLTLLALAAGRRRRRH